jgi:type IV secretion system protein VirB6
MNFVYYVLIYNWLTDKINTFGMTLMAHLMTWASGIALVLVTLWIMIKGYRIVTGQAQESMMALVSNMARVVLIVTAATTMAVAGTNLHTFFTTDLSTDVNQIFSGNNDTTAQTIDQNLAWTQLALGAIDAVQVPADDAENAAAKDHAMLLAGLGTASAPMAAGAMLLLYQFTMALFIGFGPIFILCLIFEQTKGLFQRWLLYGIGTIFSMAMLAVVSSMVLQLTLKVAAALWSANIINAITGSGAEGLSSQALQQGGLGLLMTVLIISVPPMAAVFFQGTVGNFMHFSAFGGGALSQPGPQGQPPGSYGAGSSMANSPYANTSSRSTAGDVLNSNSNAGVRGSSVTGPAQLDTVKLPPLERT